MPDNLTVYLTDDHPNGGLYKFLMDQPGDLGSGTLYAARLQQKSTTVQGTGGTFMVGGGEAGRPAAGLARRYAGQRSWALGAAGLGPAAGLGMDAQCCCVGRGNAQGQLVPPPGSASCTKALLVAEPPPQDSPYTRAAANRGACSIWRSSQHHRHHRHHQHQSASS
jgi:hypothetical protein